MPDPQTYTDHELIALLKAGDEGAFTAIFNRLYKQVLFHAKRIVSDLEKAEEITVDGFMKVWSERERFDHWGALQRWIFLVVRNAGIDHLRSERRLSAEQTQWMYVTEADYSDTYFRETAGYDLFFTIATAIDELAPQQKNIFLLFYKEGKSNAEIAQELNISVQAVKNTKSRALEILRKTINEEHLLLFFILLYGRL